MESEKKKVWETIKLGKYKNVDDLEKAILNGGCYICYHSKEILRYKSFKIAEKEENINLVIVSVADLGFTNNPSYKNLCSRAREFGLELCPAETGPQLRIQGPSYSRGEWLCIGMEPIIGSNINESNIFRVGCASEWNGQFLDLRTVDFLGTNPFPFNDNEKIIFRIL